MTDQRFFYRDPLQAAWMVAHNGMRFQSNFTVGLRYQDDGDDRVERHIDGCERIYIHPESLHLLQLEDGDVVFGSVLTDKGVSEPMAMGPILVQRFPAQP